MVRLKQTPDPLSKFLQYLSIQRSNGCNQLPSLSQLSQELEISIASLREQLEVARALGFVEVRPRTGIRKMDYSFKPAVSKSLHFAMACEPESFQAFADLRNHIESAYWYQAVSQLMIEDHDNLRSFDRASARKVGRSAGADPAQRAPGAASCHISSSR
jgi:DNA-binding FadR family transcriptional regulator